MDKSKVFKKVFIAKDIVLCLMFLIAAAFPLGSMSGVNIESPYKIIYLFFSNAINSNVDKEHIDILFISSIWYILTAVAVFPFFKRYNNHFKIVGTICQIISVILYSVPLIIYASISFKFYGLTSNTFIPFMSVYCVLETVFIIIEYFAFRKNTDENADGGTEEEEVGEESVGVKRLLTLDKVIDVISLFFVPIAVIIVSVYFSPTKLNNTANFYGTPCGSALNYNLDDSFLGFVGIDDEYMRNFGLNFQEGSTHVLTYKSNNYYYWQKKIEEKNEEIKKLMPDSDSLEDLQKYAEKIDKLQNEIKIINESLTTLNYENIKVTTVSRSETISSGGFGSGWTHTDYYADITEIIYDTQYNNSSSGIKWDNKENKRLFCNQSIELAQTEFKAGTDFSSVKIGVTINYYDGSIKKCYITPSNYEELNDSSIGEHTLKWSDSWGSYEYVIKIK